MSRFSSLEQFDDDFTVPTRRKIDLDLVPNGTYEVEVGKAELAETDKSRETIFKLPLFFTTGGCAGDYVERAYFFRGHEQVEKLTGDLKIMGFPVHDWAPTRDAQGNKVPAKKKFSVELPKAAEAMHGLKLKVTKSSRKDGNGKEWHNLHIAERIGPAPAALPEGEVVASYDADQPF